jgi:hypothetical protein
MNRLAVQAVAGIVVAVFAGGIWISGDTVQPGWLRFFSAAVLAATWFLVLFERYLWRLPPVQKIPNVPRSLRGTWRGTLSSLWIDPATGRSPEPKTVYLVVRQTASTAQVKLLTNETTSQSTLASVSDVNGSASLDYLYLDRPKASVRHRSPIHHGSGSLSVSGRPATRLHGQYWTDRDSRGEVDFVERRQELADDFEAAQELFASRP